MKKSYIFLFLFFSISFSLFSQNTLNGILTDSDSREELIGVNIIYPGGGTTSEFDGSYSLDLPAGKHEITFSYVGYQSVIENITMGSEPIRLSFEMSSGEILTEISVTADIAIARKTPVAFSNIPTLKLEEELAAQDIPMILNSTPGAYATASGGGDGDARITIRGFSQRNVAVMLDGIPVNDMENGWVYWSNWFGLDLVTKTMQVQRGLGASKLAIPSVGGTINILTKGIDAKRGGRIRQEVGNDGYLRTTFGLTSGRMKNGWGVSVAGSYKRGNGWVDGAFTEGYFYYLRLDKQIGKHLFSFSGFGAPQEHGQRPFTQEIAKYDAATALELGVPQDRITALSNLADNGRRYNEFYGTLNGEGINSSVNYYHKPQYSVRHSWQASEKFFLSNVAYVSVGNGGGARVNSRLYDEDGQMNLTKMYADNEPNIFNQGRSSFYLRSSVNNHFWVGALSTFRYNINKELTLSGGLDLRQYRGGHYRTVYDLMGGEYVQEASGRNARLNNRENELGIEDKFGYHYDGVVRWGGVFGLLEYSKDKISVFANVSTAMTGYKMEDYLWDKEITIDGEKRYVGYFENVSGDSELLERVVVDENIMYTVDSPSSEAISYAEANGLMVDSTSAQNQVIDFIWKPTFTIKTGASYNIDDHHTVFGNLGYFSRAPQYNNVINRLYTDRFPITDNSDNVIGHVQEQGKIVEAANTENEQVYALELGYGFKSKIFSANLNSYYTVWNNKPLDRLPTVLEDPTDPESPRIPINVSGISALHKGIELDFALRVHPTLTIEGLASLGDWIWNSAAKTTLPNGAIYEFDADGVHVGDAAQTQFGGMIRYEPIKGLYIKGKATYFGRNYSSFAPETLRGDDGGKESWQLPNYTIFDFHTGYRFRVKGLKMSLRFNILNILDATYISDARNNDNFVSSFNGGFNAQSASVHFGQGRRWSTGLTVSF
jgi:iron complex outermembrane receptor protein